MISKHRINELQEILKQDFNVELSDDDAVDFGNFLTNFFSLLAKQSAEMNKKEVENARS